MVITTVLISILCQLLLVGCVHRSDLTQPVYVPTNSKIQLQSNKCSNLDECLTKAKGSLDIGQLNEAKDYATQAIHFDPNSQLAHMLLGTILLKLSKWSNAHIEFEKVVQINPRTPEGLRAQKWLDKIKNPRNITFIYFEAGDIEVNINPMLKDINPDLVKRAEAQVKNQCRNAANMLADSLQNSGLFKVRRENRNRRDIVRIIDDYKKACFPKGIDKASGKEYTKLYINCETIDMSCVSNKKVGKLPNDNSSNVAYVFFNITAKFNIGIYDTKTSRLKNRLSRIYTITNVPLLRATLNNNRLNYSFRLNDMKEILKRFYGQLFYDINTLLV